MAAISDAVDVYEARVRSGQITWGRWSVSLIDLALVHADGFHARFLPFHSVQEAVAHYLPCFLQKGVRFDVSDIGHFLRAVHDLYGALDSVPVDPIHVLSPHIITLDMPPPMTRAQLRGVGGVYCVLAADHVKIGHAADIAKRVSDLQIASPSELQVLGVLDVDPRNERDWHRRFHHLRVRGEWFLMCDQIAVVARSKRWDIERDLEAEADTRRDALEERFDR